jgi:hypothetical protein
MALTIQAQVPEYGWPPDSEYGKRMLDRIMLGVTHFVDIIENPNTHWDHISAIYQKLGAYEARKGRNLDRLQGAMRICCQIACRGFTQEAHRLDLSPETLGLLSESLFAYLDRIVDFASDGYAQASAESASEYERVRARLRDLLISDPPASHELIADTARAAEWTRPRTIAVVAVRPAANDIFPVVPPTVLANWTAPTPYFVLPDPDNPGQQRLATTIAGRGLAAQGPTTSLRQGSMSLRWAKQALALADRGVIGPAGGGAPTLSPSGRGPSNGSTPSGSTPSGGAPSAGAGIIRCADHIPTLVAAATQDLIETAVPSRLGALLSIRQPKRDRLAQTMLTYLETGSATAIAERLHIHPQTARYRVRQLEVLFGDTLRDVDARLELQLILHTWLTLRPTP